MIGQSDCALNLHKSEGIVRNCRSEKENNCCKSGVRVLKYNLRIVYMRAKRTIFGRVCPGKEQ